LVFARTRGASGIGLRQLTEFAGDPARNVLAETREVPPCAGLDVERIGPAGDCTTRRRHGGDRAQLLERALLFDATEYPPVCPIAEHLLHIQRKIASDERRDEQKVRLVRTQPAAVEPHLRPD